MATSVRKLHHAILQRVNQSDRAYLKGLSVAERDAYINRAKDWLLPRWAVHVGRNGYIDDQLRQIIVRGDSLPILSTTEEYVEAAYPDSLLRTVRVTASIEHVDDCCDPQTAVVRIVSSDKLHEFLRSAFRSPSFDYRETVGIVSDKGVRVYSGDDFNVKSVFLDYVRNVRDIQAPSLERAEKYINMDGEEVTEDVNFELDSPDIVQKIAGIAALFALNDNQYLNNFQSLLQELASAPGVAIR